MAGGQTISMSETRAEALTLQSSAYGVTKTVVHGTTRIAGNLADYLDFKAIAHVDRQTAGKGGGVTTESTSYTYTVTMVMNLCEGRTDGVPIDVKAVWRGKTIYRTKDGQSPLAQVGASLLGGALGQSVWSPLNTLANGTHAIGYSGMACIAAQDYDLGGSAQIENHLFEVAAGGRLNLTAGTTLDADPAVVIQDWLTNDVWGLAIDSSMMGSMAQYSAYCRAAGLLMSPALSEQANASDRIKDMCDLTNAWPVMMDNAVHIVPLGDETLTGNDATYTPDIEPVAHLTADVCKKIRPRRKAPADAYNIVKVEYKSRDNDYNVAVADAKDLASIEQFGARTAPTIQAHWICDKATADKVAQIALKRFRYILNTYEAYVPWNFAYLVPSSICTLTDPDEGLDAAWVRIKTIEEDDGGYKLEMEEFPHAVSSVSTGTLPSLGGYKHDYNVEPGAIAVPQFFEAPVELTTTGLEVLVAVAGTGQNWGGCQVWVSNDGTGYQQVATIYGGSRYGTLSSQLAAAPAGTLAVQLAGRGGQIISGSALDAERLATLCWVKGTANGSKAEYLAFEQATMVSTNEYTMTGLVRGAYGTSQSAKPAGSRFVRIDETIGRSGPLQPDMIGQTLHFKFASFNVYGGAPQQLDECDEYTYTITGEMMRLPPATVTSITAAARVFGIDLSLVIPQQAANLKTTQVWSSHINDRATATKLVDLAYPASTHSITGLSSGEQMYFWARLIDGYDNIGEWYPASATGGVPGAASSDASQILDYLSGQISATQLSQALKEKVALIDVVDANPFSAAQAWNLQGSLRGWIAYAGGGVGYGSLASGSEYATATTNQYSVGFHISIITSDPTPFAGASAPIIRAYVSKPTNNAPWNGYLFYGAVGHTYPEDWNFVCHADEPVWDASGWGVAEWNMAVDSSNPNDWLASTINHLRFDITYGAPNPSEIKIKWIAAGSRQTPPSFSVVKDLQDTYGSTASAATSATNAANSAAAAAQAKADAITAQGGAANSATTATNKASEAATSATNAAGSASSASSAASTAATAATNAGNSATAAAGSATNAASSATDAGNSATASSSAKVAAESARDAASGSATAAATSANTATTKASEAATSATSASTSANTATTKAGQASTSATNAASSETNAAGSASSAASSATAAAGSATNAGNSATAAAGSATTASTQATNAGNSATAAIAASVAAESARDSATGSANAAATSASTASTKASEAATSASSASTSANTASTKAGEASTSATNAAGSATNAAGSANSASTQATNAATSATTAGSHASAAATSASQASTSATNASNSATASASILTQVQSEVDGAMAAVQTEASTRAGETTGLKAQYSVKVNVNGKVAGYGLSSTATNATPTSEFSVLADRFSISSGSDANYPFVIEGGNTYINKAFIGTGWITNAMIGNVIQSTSFTDGSDGWEINKAGSIKAYNVTLRGGLDVGSTGYVRGGQTAYNTGVGFWGGYSGGAYKFSMGNPSGNYLTYDGTDMVLKGRFAADSIDAVDTLNIKGDAVVVPANGYYYRATVNGSAPEQTQDQVLISLPEVLFQRETKVAFFLSYYFNGNDVGNSYTVYLQIVRGSTVIYQSPSLLYDPGDGTIAGKSSTLFSIFDTAPIGTHEYKVRLHVASVPSATGNFEPGSDVSIIMFAVK